jgi:integrase
MQPLARQTMRDKQALPLIEPRLIEPTLGWYSFRRIFTTWLYANEGDVKTTQELMRHSTSMVTMGVYAQAVTAAKREAQSWIDPGAGGNAKRTSFGLIFLSIP